MSIRSSTLLSLVCSLLLLTAPVTAQPVGFDDLNASSDRMAGCPAAAPAAADSRFDLHYELKVRFHTYVKGNVDVVWAGGKLLMNGQPDGKGSLAMSLIQPLEAPWKFYTQAQDGYHDVYYLSERTLPAGTWPARDASVIDNRELGKERCEKWAKEWGGKHVDLQTLPFWVIGDPTGRRQPSMP